jgi:RimJ/RimL family protein N-acetyltransferase
MLQGDRVVLRAIEREDVPALADLWRDLETATRRSNYPPLPRNRAEAEARFDRDAKDPPHDEAWFAVEAGGNVIGQCGLHHIDHYAGHCGLGIALRRDRWGQGYGQDAVRTLVHYAFRDLNLRKVWLECMADDERAVGAYRKAGFEEEGRMREQAWYDGAYRDVLVMAVFRDRSEGSVG